MHYLLIYWLLAGPSGYAPTGTAEFDDQAACEAALVAINQAGPWVGPPGVCVPKGSAAALAPAPATPSSPSVPSGTPSSPAPPSAPTIAKPGTCPPGSPRPTC